MENLYYYIIVIAIIIEYLFSSISSILDIKNITPTIPSDFKKHTTKRNIFYPKIILKHVQGLAYFQVPSA